MKFIGRENEQKMINRAFSSDQFELILIYGRRHVGKTELIRKCAQNFTGKFFYYMCRQVRESLLLEGFRNVLAESLDLNGLYFKSFEDSLRYLFELGRKEKIVVALDEYPNARKNIDGLDSIIQALADEYKDVSKLKLVLAGSYLDVMKEIKGEKQPLYGRITLNINLKPMDYYDSSKFYSDFTNDEKVQLYSIFGGIPLYNALIRSDISVKDNIISLAASENARLSDEVDMFLSAELTKLENANSVFNALTEGKNTFNEIQNSSGIESSAVLNDILKKLINMEVIQKEFPINKENDKSKAKYIICDNYFSFYFRFISRHLSQMKIMDENTFYERYIQKEFNEHYVPHKFEDICREYLIRKNRMGLINPVIEKIGKYYYDSPAEHKNGEFDVVTQDVKGYAFYECKYKSLPMSAGSINKEIHQVEMTNLRSYKYGFFSKSGFENDVRKDIICYTLDDLYQIH